MRITDRYQALTDRASTTAAKPTAKNEKIESGSRSNGVSLQGDAVNVRVSGRAHELASQSAAKVQELKASIADGSFKVDSTAIAKSLVGGDGDGD